MRRCLLWCVSNRISPQMLWIGTPTLFVFSCLLHLPPDPLPRSYYLHKDMYTFICCFSSFTSGHATRKPVWTTFCSRSQSTSSSSSFYSWRCCCCRRHTLLLNLVCTCGVYSPHEASQRKAGATTARHQRDVWKNDCDQTRRSSRSE